MLEQTFTKFWHLQTDLKNSELIEGPTKHDLQTMCNGFTSHASQMENP